VGAASPLLSRADPCGTEIRAWSSLESLICRENSARRRCRRLSLERNAQHFLTSTPSPGIHPAAQTGKNGRGVWPIASLALA